MNPIKLLILTFCAPDFWKRMPKNDSQEYCMETYTFSHWHESIKSSNILKGKRAAYIQVRWDAMLLDWGTDDYNGELGIGWRLSKIN